jgi:hypothetical protein
VDAMRNNRPSCDNDNDEYGHHTTVLRRQNLDLFKQAVISCTSRARPARVKVGVLLNSSMGKSIGIVKAERTSTLISSDIS